MSATTPEMGIDYDRRLRRRRHRTALNPLHIYLAGFGLTLWGAYQGGRRYPLAGSFLAILLLIGAGLLMRLDLRASSLGDGAPSSAAAFLGLLLLIQIAAIVLAGTLLVAGWMADDHPLPKSLLLFGFLPFVGYVAFTEIPDSKHAPAQPATRAIVNPEQKGGRKDGYVWALDSQFLSEDDCRNGSAEFLAGCRDGVAKNRTLQSQ